MSTARKVGRTEICPQQKKPSFSGSCMIQSGSFSDPRAKVSETFSLQAKSKKKNKISFNCQILEQKLPFPNHTTPGKTGFFFLGQKPPDLLGGTHMKKTISGVAAVFSSFWQYGVNMGFFEKTCFCALSKSGINGFKMLELFFFTYQKHPRKTFTNFCTHRIDHIKHPANDLD